MFLLEKQKHHVKSATNQGFEILHFYSIYLLFFFFFSYKIKLFPGVLIRLLYVVIQKAFKNLHCSELN